VIMRGVKIAEWNAFYNCRALTGAVCGKLELIEEGAFSGCKSLRRINLPSARIVERCAFYKCYTLTDAKFGNKLERFDREAFDHCRSLERITIPLKDGMITEFDTFRSCKNLKHVDLVSRVKNYVKPLLRCTWRGGEMI